MSRSFLDASIPALLKDLQLDEKIKLLGAPNWWNTHGVERLGIPAVRMSDGPNVGVFEPQSLSSTSEDWWPLPGRQRIILLFHYPCAVPASKIWAFLISGRSMLILSSAQRHSLPHLMQAWFKKLEYSLDKNPKPSLQWFFSHRHAIFKGRPLEVVPMNHFPKIRICQVRYIYFRFAN